MAPSKEHIPLSLSLLLLVISELTMFCTCILLTLLFFLGHWLLGSLFSPEDGGSTFLRNIHERLLEYMASHPRK
jgi:hypothetical protein